MPGNNQMVIDFLGDGRITLPKVEKLMPVIKTQSGSEEFELSAGQLIITGLKKGWRSIASGANSSNLKNSISGLQIFDKHPDLYNPFQ